MEAQMANFEFYDVKTRSKIQLPESNVYKTKFVKNGRTTYALRGTTGNGRAVTKFVSKKDWDTLQVAEK
jgi:hypothetical protein